MPQPTLADVPLGRSARILRVAAPRPLAVRLMEMGLVPGTEVVLRRKAPLGDPLELELRGYSLSIRRSDAAQIEIAAEGSAAPAKGGAGGADG